MTSNSSGADTPSDQTAPVQPAQLLQRLEELGIQSLSVHHAPVFTVEEAKRHRGELSGSHIKNLFLRNKKGAMWLVVALEDREIDLKGLGALLGAGRLSFGSAERLMKYLGVIPGAVTPFGVINDQEGAVKVVLDKGLFDNDPVNCHPLTNDMTTSLAAADLVRFLEAVGHPPDIIDLGVADQD